MAIGTTAALIGSAVVGAGSSALAASKNKKAINKATQAQTDANAASLAEQRRQFDISSQNLSPFIRGGTGANSMINALLGIPEQGGGTQGNYVGPNALSGPATLGDGGFQDYGIIGDSGYPTTGTIPMPGIISGYGGGTFNTDGTQVTPDAQGNMRQRAEDAFDIFRNSTGYQFRVNQGQDAINTGYAARGLLQSGAALKSLDDYRQNMASAEFGNYLGTLQDQARLGFGAASAQAGVGQNFAQGVTSLNAANANALAGGALAKASNSNALIGNIGGALGGILGGFGGSSFSNPFGAQQGITFNPNNARNIMGIGGF